ncbi:SGS-domain-containing protein [Canariomyces notabilis]|uniref:SGS-domain-containing protein n=1 Tax=Canariomyces notabilis TaxID=2074819 RepID=A0AAN6THZ4_9PEZI|nr:SGS-domain-containing protein [Canariomyces arenarius]
MSATTLAHKGCEAVKNKDWEAAIPLLDQALKSSDSPIWLLARAQAHQQLRNYDAALRDAALAFISATERGSGNARKYMIDAQYRRSVVYYKLGRYADADCCAKWSMLLAEGRPAFEKDGVEKNVDENGNYTVTYEQGIADKQGQPIDSAYDRTYRRQVLGMVQEQSESVASKTGFEAEWKRAYAWRSQVLATLKTVPEDHSGRKVSVTKFPDKPKQEMAEKKPEPKPESQVGDSDDDKPVEVKGPAPGTVPDEQLKLRVDFYQTNQTVTVALFAKDVKKEDLQVNFFQNYQVQISPLPRAADPYVKPGDREAASTFILGGEIIPSASRWSVTPRKIELVLQKANAGLKWSTWGKEEIGLVAAGSDGDVQPENNATATAAAAPAAPPAAPPAKPTNAPAYPTSSRSGPKDWEKLGEGEDELDEKDVNYFFKQLYKGATPEQQRAMMKSFIESNGTALSTDWDDVKNRTVETVPPEGVEAKKWES